MKGNTNKKGILGGMGLIIMIFHCYISMAQTFSAHQNVSIGINSNGFYDYLPLGYSAQGIQKYPLLIALHGTDEKGNGNTQLLRLVSNGIPKLISKNKFPSSVTTSSGTYSFIVFAPQFKVIPSLADIDAVVSYAMNNYNVDFSRVYLTGYSMGGGAVWEYAGSSAIDGNRFAAIVPVSGAFSSAPDYSAARIVAGINLPVWATHNMNDPVVTSSNTVTMIGYINEAPAPVPAALKTIFNSSVHDAWTKTYDPLYIDPNTGFNIYEWMLQYEARSVTLPVVLSYFNVSLKTSQKVLIEWTTSEEKNNRSFAVERSSNGELFKLLVEIPSQNLQSGSGYSFTDIHPAIGDNYYRLTQTDLDGSRHSFPVKKIILNDAFLRNIYVSPNPASSTALIQLNFPETGIMNLRLVSNSGTVLKTYSIDKTGPHWEQSMDISDMSCGMYYIQLTGVGRNLEFSFIKK